MKYISTVNWLPVLVRCVQIQGITNFKTVTTRRYYYLNEGDIIPGKVNVIAVRVYDAGGEGGIYSGTIGLFKLKPLYPTGESVLRKVIRD